MQISTPTQAQSPVEEGGYPKEIRFAENSPAWRRKVQKKNAGGIFAKLLEGLTAKIKTDNNSKGILGQDKIKKAEGETPQGNTLKNALKAGQNAKKPQNSGMEEGIFLDEAIPGAVPFFLRQDNLLAEQNSGAAFGSGIYRSVRRRDGPAGDFRPQSSLKQDVQPDFSAGKGGEQKNSALHVPLSRADKAERTAFAGLAGTEKAKNAVRTEAVIRTAPEPGSENTVFQAQSGNGFINRVRPERAEREDSLSVKNPGKKNKERINTGTQSGNVQETGQEAGKLELSKTHNIDAVKSTEIELPVNLSLQAEKAEETAGKTGKDHSKGSLFEDALARELRGNLSADIVREAAVIVKSAGEGTIRLSLRPASLGDVKIRLEMAENKITGHIILQNSEALRAFERELPVLEKAFRDSGYSETNLSMSLAQDGGNYGAGEQRQEGEFQALATAVAASRYEAETGWVEEASDQGAVAYSASPGRKAVNLFI